LELLAVTLAEVNEKKNQYNVNRITRYYLNWIKHLGTDYLIEVQTIIAMLQQELLDFDKVIGRIYYHMDKLINAK